VKSIQNEVIRVIERHRSIRAFQNQPVPAGVIEELIGAAQRTSTSSNLQAYSVIWVKDQTKKETIAQLAGQQKHIVECPVFLVFCADLYRLKAAGQIAGNGFDTDYFENYLVAAMDTALLAQSFMLAAESIDLGGVYIGGIRNNLPEMTSLLELPEYTVPLFGMCIGYPDPGRIPDLKPRLATDSILHTDAYDAGKAAEAVHRYDQVMEEYFTKRDSNRKASNWSQQISKKYATTTRTNIRQTAERQQFGLK
jgi:FMN reductase (NADPH)